METDKTILISGNCISTVLCNCIKVMNIVIKFNYNIRAPVQNISEDFSALSRSGCTAANLFSAKRAINNLRHSGNENCQKCFSGSCRFSFTECCNILFFLYLIIVVIMLEFLSNKMFGLI